MRLTARLKITFAPSARCAALWARNAFKLRLSMSYLGLHFSIPPDMSSSSTAISPYIFSMLL